ncbi:hypothetical protein Tsubulata_048331 [Turnera subulata]|uniref:glutathione transferase n=1 Tax=Turnera subulata TaxID=218843 RepID=A0A9Q0J6N6_9ROSI|nr:hypothetical protein Tsubulata_048331 [Turnera subulata]
MATIKVHGVPDSPAVARVLVCLYEKELDFELVPVDFKTAENKKEPFISLNPFGLLPALEDGDAKMIFAREAIINPLRGLPTDTALLEESKAKLSNILDVYEARLGQSKYLAGDSFTLADLHHIPTISFLMNKSWKDLFDSETRPHVNAWVAAITSRPAWAKVLALRDKY